MGWNEGAGYTGHEMIVEEKGLHESKKKKPYARLTLRDKEAAITANLWDYDESKHGFIQIGSVVSIDGVIEMYQGKPQMKLDRIEPSSSDPLLFMRKSKFDTDSLWLQLVDLVGQFREPLTKYVVEEGLLKIASYEQLAKMVPAGKKVHNSWRGGLIEHIWSMCQLVPAVVSHYRNNYDAPISTDKVYFGVIMHDIGKIWEYEAKGATFDLSPFGLLANHIVMGPALVLNMAEKFRKTYPLDALKVSTDDFRMELAQLMHLIASHHGTLEFGSPVRPATLEALILHHLDMLDSKFMHALEMIREKPGEIKGFTEKSWFEGNCFYMEGGRSVIPPVI